MALDCCGVPVENLSLKDASIGCVVYKMAIRQYKMKFRWQVEADLKEKRTDPVSLPHP
jgi:hypothetical protein